MNVTQETVALRTKLHKLASNPEWSLLVRYELLPQKPIPAWHLRLCYQIGRLLRVLGLNRTRYRRQPWHASLKHGTNYPSAKVLLIWSEGHDRETIRQACDGLKNMLSERTDLLPVLVTDLADFSYYSRLGWLVEYLPELNGDKKRLYLAWRYRNALTVPLSVGLTDKDQLNECLSASK